MTNCMMIKLNGMKNVIFTLIKVEKFIKEKKIWLIRKNKKRISRYGL